ncbi:MAG: hypothetical protein GF398_18475 [Chitinivibrionales bacterium]|nr:hypothetical protein [Chitinivibrionales bacterium]
MSSCNNFRRGGFIVKAKSVLTALVTVCTALGLLTCTISEDAGNLVDPGTPQQQIVQDGLPTLSVTTDTGYVVAGDTMPIYITVKKDSLVGDTLLPIAAYRRAQVSVSASSGWLSHDTLITDSTGRALVMFSDSVPRSNVQVTVYVYGVRQTINFDVTQTTIQNQTIIPTILASADSAYVRIGDTIAIRVHVLRDSAMNPYAGAIIVTEASTGWISSDTLVTNTDGRAVLLYTDSVQRDNVQVTFTNGGVTQTARFDVTNTPIQIQKLIEAIPDVPSIKADGKDFTNINVRVINTDHNPIVGEPVRFIATSGVIKGSDPGNSGQSLTNEEGIATAKLTSTNINDTAFVTVFLASNRSMSDETQVAFQGVKIELLHDSTNLRLNGRTRIVAHLKNASNVAIANAPIFFSLGRGANSNLSIIPGSVDSVTGFDGKAAIEVQGNATGTDSIVVVAAGAKSQTNINVTDLMLDVVLYPEIIQARRGKEADLTVNFSQSNGSALSNKVIRVVRHFLKTNKGDTTDTLWDTTNTVGQSIVKIPALHYEGNIRLEVTAVNSPAEIATSEVTLQCITTRSMMIHALPSVIPADGTSKSQISVQIKNEDNNPIAGDEVIFTSDAGLIPGSATTDQNGKAVVFLTSDRRNYRATVIGRLEKDPSKQVSIQVEFTGVELRAAASPQSINSSGSDSSTVTVTLTDGMRNPIVGESVNFIKQQSATTIVSVDSAVTDNRGEAQFKVFGTGASTDTMTFEAADATAKTVVWYSENKLTIDTIPAVAGAHTYIANGKDSTLLTVTYQTGGGQPIPNAQVEISITMGDIPGPSDSIFAILDTTDANGRAQVYVINPDFSNTATIQATAKLGSEITAASKRVYFRAAPIHHIELVGTPEVISTNGDRAKITAYAFDEQGNRVGNTTVAFNMISGPGGGEYLEPPTAITGLDGSATTYLVSGSIPSKYREVEIVGGDFTAIKSDTVRFTIAGPPHYITIRRDIGELVDYPNGTYGKKVAAIVTDINGNPVADGTEVTFSLNIIGYYIYKLSPKFFPVAWTSDWDYLVDTVAILLPFEDLNDNYKIDTHEDLNRDGMPNRGEDVNGDGKFQPGPGFVDYNWNGIRDSFPEPLCSYCDGKFVFADYNGNGVRDVVEPFMDTAMTDSIYRLLPGYDPALGRYVDIDWNQNGVADPATAATITRTIQTVGGIAENEMIYGQSDALRIRVRLNAEAQGVVTTSAEEFTLPILITDRKYWSYR